MDLRVAQGAGLLFVDLHDDARRLVDHGLGERGRGREAEIAVAVHRGDGDDIGVIVIVCADRLGHVAVVGGDQIAEAAVDGLSRTAAGEPRNAHDLDEERLIRVERIGIAVQHGVDLDALELARLRARRDRHQETVRLRRAGVGADDPAALDELGCLGGRAELLLIHSFIICHFGLHSFEFYNS